MRYLLDTHTFLWLAFEPENIGVKAKVLITNPEHAIRRKIPVATKAEDFKLYKPHGLRIVW